MNSFHRLLVHCIIGCMVLGMVNLAMASPLSRENLGMELSGVKSGSKNQKMVTGPNRGLGGVAGGCSSHLTEGPDLYFIALHGSDVRDCSSQLGEEAVEIFSPGCARFEASKNRMSSGQCAADEQLVTNFGNLIVHSSDQVLGRVDVLENPSALPNPHSTVLSDNQPENKSLNKLSPSIVSKHVLMTKAFRHDRMSTELFDGEKEGGVSPDLAFDHQLVMSGKLAHLVPKAGQSPRSLELGDLVILLLFAMLPEKKHIKHLIRRTRQFRLF